MFQILPRPPIREKFTIENKETKEREDSYIWKVWLQQFWTLWDHQIRINQKATDPVLADIYVNTWVIYKNTGTGAVKIWANDAGTLKSVALV